MCIHFAGRINSTALYSGVDSEISIFPIIKILHKWELRGFNTLSGSSNCNHLLPHPFTYSLYHQTESKCDRLVKMDRARWKWTEGICNWEENKLGFSHPQSYKSWRKIQKESVSYFFLFISGKLENQIFSCQFVWIFLYNEKVCKSFQHRHKGTALWPFIHCVGSLSQSFIRYWQ